MNDNDIDGIKRLVKHIVNSSNEILNDHDKILCKIYCYLIQLDIYTSEGYYSLVPSLISLVKSLIQDNDLHHKPFIEYILNYYVLLSMLAQGIEYGCFMKLCSKFESNILELPNELLSKKLLHMNMIIIKSALDSKNSVIACNSLDQSRIGFSCENLLSILSTKSSYPEIKRKLKKILECSDQSETFYFEYLDMLFYLNNLLLSSKHDKSELVKKIESIKTYKSKNS
ncbi:MAG: hypothetical protein MHPSP_001554, partial [Paramarteilia canceri]